MSAWLRRRRPYVHPRFGECHSDSPSSMPRIFDPLATFNGEKARGIVHGEEYREEMARLQGLFDAWQRERGGMTP